MRAAHHVVGVATGHPTSSPRDADVRDGLSVARRRSVARRHLVLRLTSERTVPLAVAVVVLLAGVATLGPSIVRPVGAAQDGSRDVRLSIGGGVAAAPYFPAEVPRLHALDSSASLGESIDDGSLYKPVAVDTTAAGATDLMQHYTVKAGDSLAAIAVQYHRSMASILWANQLTSSDELRIGQVLVIPPVNGLVVTVAAGQTLDSLAAKYHDTGDQIIAANDLTDTHLVVGELLVMPGAKVATTVAPKVTVAKPRTIKSGVAGHGSFTWTGGAWHWPVVGGGNYISQPFWSGHLGVDIAAQSGTPIVAPLAARVVFAGWKSNGGGYQVWLNYGNGLYSGLYHMSSVTVSVGQVVARGQQIGRIGMTGWATGPHVHFEVWIGYPWKSSSYRVNPMRYF